MNEQQTNEIETLNDDVDYINTIKDLKENTVSKDEYNRLRERNKQLLDTLTNGSQLEQQPEIKERSKSEIVKDWINSDNLNIQNVKALLELRERVIRDEEYDPAMPSGPNIKLMGNEEAINKRVADTLERCLEESNGSNRVFTSLLYDSLVDTFIPKRN